MPFTFLAFISTYVFGIHFNALFLVYCAALGFSTFGLAALLSRLKPENVRGWYEARFPRKWTSITQIVIALAFAALWLSDIVPAITRGVAPKAVSNDLLFTNPVHVLDLSFALPALMFSGIQLLRGRDWGYVLSPMLMTLSVLMAVAIGGMTLTSIIMKQPTDAGVLATFAAIAVVCGAVLVALLRRIRAG